MWVQLLEGGFKRLWVSVSACCYTRARRMCARVHMFMCTRMCAYIHVCLCAHIRVCKCLCSFVRNVYACVQGLQADLAEQAAAVRQQQQVRQQLEEQMGAARAELEELAARASQQRAEEVRACTRVRVS